MEYDTGNTLILRGKITSAPGIYIIRSIKTGRMYVGSSVSVKRRYSEHISMLKLGCHSNPFLQHHVNKYGKEDIELLIVELVKDPQELIIREQYWMEYLQPIFNGDVPHPTRLGAFFSEEAKIKLSLSQKKRLADPAIRERIRQKALVWFSNPENREKHKIAMKNCFEKNGYPMQGRKHTEETKCKIRKGVGNRKGPNNGMYGKYHSEETKRKMRETLGDQAGLNNGMYGKCHSEETKRKIREARKDLTGETRRKMSEAQKKRFAKNKQEYKLPEVE